MLFWEKVMKLNRILVPLAGNIRTLKSVHYALSLAGRLKAHVFILQQETAGKEPTSPSNAVMNSSIDDTLNELISIARQAGLAVTHYRIWNKINEEIVAWVTANKVDVLVFDDETALTERVLMDIKQLGVGQIIHVTDKHSHS